MLRFEVRYIRHSDDDLILVVPRSASSAAFAIRRTSVVMCFIAHLQPGMPSAAIHQARLLVIFPVPLGDLERYDVTLSRRKVVCLPLHVLVRFPPLASC